jgi:hypothetical protein
MASVRRTKAERAEREARELQAYANVEQDLLHAYGERIPRVNVPEGEHTIRIVFADGQRFRLAIRETGPWLVTEGRQARVVTGRWSGRRGNGPKGPESKVHLEYIDDDEGS